jgi:hypothetical protein
MARVNEYLFKIIFRLLGGNQARRPRQSTFATADYGGHCQPFMEQK